MASLTTIAAEGLQICADEHEHLSDVVAELVARTEVLRKVVNDLRTYLAQVDLPTQPAVPPGVPAFDVIEL